MERQLQSLMFRITGYRKAGEDNAYAIPLLEVVDGEQKGLMAVCIKRAEVR